MLTSLVQKSLVVYEEDEQGQGRYRLLETVRQYSGDRLVEAGSSAATRGQHLQFCLRLVEEAEPRLRSFEQKIWAARLESEHDNLRVALERAIAYDPETVLRLAGTLWWFWYRSGHAREGRDWLERALAPERVQGSAAEAARAKALLALGHFASEQGEPEIGLAHLGESLAIYQRREDLPGCVLALALLAIFVVVESPAAAGSLAQESLTLARRLNEPWYLGWALLLQGEIARGTGDLGEAAGYYAEAAAAHRCCGEEFLHGCSLHNLGCVRWRQGDLGQARALFQESLVLFREQGSVVGIANCLASLARSSSLERHSVRTARLLGAAGRLLDSIGLKLQPVDQAESDDAQRNGIGSGGDQLPVANLIIARAVLAQVVHEATIVEQGFEQAIEIVGGGGLLPILAPEQSHSFHMLQERASVIGHVNPVRRQHTGRVGGLRPDRKSACHESSQGEVQRQSLHGSISFSDRGHGEWL